ncbi:MULTISPECIES: hypothetical protein [unclassified Paenibacillus]|uniref:hypothetical protein n=1 Tax=unclassified Paenibacillus TaxID=185978 RepID=UPI00362F234E
MSGRDEEAWLNGMGLGLGLIHTNEVPKMEFVSAKGKRKFSSHSKWITSMNFTKR